MNRFCVWPKDVYSVEIVDRVHIQGGQNSLFYQQSFTIYVAYTNQLILYNFLMPFTFLSNTALTIRFPLVKAYSTIITKETDLHSAHVLWSAMAFLYLIRIKISVVSQWFECVSMRVGDGLGKWADRNASFIHYNKKPIHLESI